MKKHLTSFRSTNPAARRTLVAALALFAGTAVQAQTIVDNSGSARNGKVGYWSSIVAGGGDVGISYYCEDDHAGSPPEMYTLRFAWRNGSQWQWTTVDTSAGSDTSMRRGTDGLYRIAYETWYGAGFAIGSGQSWNVSSVDIAPEISPTQISMTLDSQQRPHIAYMNLANGGDYSMRYTRWDGSQWVHDSAELLLTGIWTPTIGFSNTWLQLDQNDVPHIAFAQPTDTVNAWGPIRYATLQNGTWTYENLGVDGVDPSLAIGTDNQPRMLFNSNTGITYAYKDAGGWHFEDVAPGQNGDGNSLALSDSGQPFATFGMTANEDQYIARRDAGGWVVTKIDGDGTNGPHVILGRYGNSIDVDENNTPHVSYLNIDIYGPTHRCDLMYLGDAGGQTSCVQVTQQPQSVTVCANQGAAFTALGQSPETLTYSWDWQPAGSSTWSQVVEGSNIDPQTGQGFVAQGSTSSTLSIPAQGITLAGVASFRSVLVSSCGSATTSPAFLTVGSVPNILTQPANAQTCGTPVRFDVAVDAAATYQWQWSPSGTGAWLDLNENANIDPSTSGIAFYALGSFSNSLQLSSIQLNQGASHLFRCVITTPCGGVTSDAATLSSGAAQITDQPDTQTLCEGTPAKFDVISTDGSAGVQWEMYDAHEYGWMPIAEGYNYHNILGEFIATGANAASITMEGFLDDGGNHDPRHGTMEVRCLLTGTCGNATSDTASLTVIACCPADFNRDGAVDFFDYDDFVVCFEGGSCPQGTTADFDSDGSIDFFDYDAFVMAFEQGC
ncbi:MAG: hypothetical protein AABZ53_06555 [Planctomycetota bacterium]